MVPIVAARVVLRQHASRHLPASFQPGAASCGILPVEERVALQYHAPQ